MNIPILLNVALGVIILYLLLSTIASLLLEVLTKVLSYREEILFVTINRLLAGEPDEPWSLPALALDRAARRLPSGDGPVGLWRRMRGRWRFEISTAYRSEQEIVRRFWQHPKIRSLASPGADAPPRMEPATFAEVVVDVAVPRNAQGLLPDNRLTLVRALSAPSSGTPAALRQTLRTLVQSSEVGVGATGDALWRPFRAHIADWFKEASARASERYRSFAQRTLLLSGIVLALALNADSFRIVHLLAQDPRLSATIAQYAETLQGPPPASPERAAALADLRRELSADIEQLRKLEQMGYPIGWFSPLGDFVGESTLRSRWENPWAIWTLLWLIKVAGCGITALAVSQGAPFWYDLMQRLLALRRGGSGTTAAAPAAAAVAAGAGAETRAQVVPPSALPLEVGHDLAAPTSGFDWRKAYWLARASAAAYSPEPELRALVLETWRFHEFAFFDEGGTQCFCAADDQVVMIAFRGTELSELRDVIDDVKIELVALERAGKQSDYRIHQGFRDALTRVQQRLSERIHEWTRPLPGRSARQIYVTGHSLGGALATLMFVELAIDPSRPVPTLYTFGCPKVGDTIFARSLDRLYPERIFRFVNETDIVPLLPPLPDYHHAGRGFYFESNGQLRTQVSGLSRVLQYAAGAAASFKAAGEKSVDDHSITHYVDRCEAFAKTASVVT